MPFFGDYSNWRVEKSMIRSVHATRRAVRCFSTNRRPALQQSHNMNCSSKQILEKIRHSREYQDYARSFQNGTGLPMILRPRETWGLPLHGCSRENPFCALMAADRKGCSSCLGAQQKLAESTGETPRTLTCFAGLRETLVPVRYNGIPLGYLQTGQVRCQPPTEEGFAEVSRQLEAMGASIDKSQLREAWFAGPTLEPERYEALVGLLRHFAGHLEMMTNQILVQMENAEAPIIQRARRFINEHHSEDINLEQVAKAVNTSTFYFCKIFKRATGLTFTEYLTRVRIEKAKEMLLNPHVRISEAAFAVGFQSLSQFNRAFKKVVGKSPTAYRNKLPRILVA